MFIRHYIKKERFITVFLNLNTTNEKSVGNSLKIWVLELSFKMVDSALISVMSVSQKLSEAVVVCS